MIISPNFQIVAARNKKYDALLHRPFLERTEAENVLVYYMLKNIGITCYFLFGVQLLPYQEIIIRTLIRKPFPILCLTRGGGKSFSLGIYSALRSIITPGSKVVIVGSNRRQGRFVFSEITKIYNNKHATLFHEIARKPVDAPEESFIEIYGDTKTSRISVFPLSSDKIRGARASNLIADEFAVIPEDVFTTVLKPMGAVSLNPVEKVRQIQREKELIEAGVISADDAMEFDSNQIVISSSASYQFTFLYKQYKEYKNIIQNALASQNKAEIKNARKYAIIQLGYQAIQELAPGYLDESNIANSKATLSFDKFETEYGAQFVSDSQGFFPRSLLENRSLKLGESPKIETKGDKNSIYVMAVDPSSGENLHNDYFAIVVAKLDLVSKALTVVYASASSGKGWPYYVKLVRACIRNFNVKYVIMDKFGGGSQVQSLLSAEEYANKDLGDKPVFALEKDDLSTYSLSNNRILRMCIFDNTWIEKANINMKSMLDHKRMWFAAPAGNEIYKGTEAQIDEFDDAQDCIEECKNQTSMIVGGQTEKGMTVFKMPDGLSQIKKRERMRKDLYTCCLLISWGSEEYFKILDGVKPTSGQYVPVFDIV